MRQIPIAASLLVFLEELEYTEAALSADPDAADLAPQFQSEIEDWDSIFSKERAGRRNVVRADAVVGVNDGTLDWTTQRFSGVVLVEAQQDRKSPVFRRYFKSSPSELIRTALRKQCEYTRDVIQPELAKVDKKSALKPFAAQFKTAVDSTLAALDARAKARGDRATSAHDVEEWKEGVNNLRTTTYAELLKRATDNSYSRAWPNNFFRQSSAAQAETDDPVAAPAQPSTSPSTPQK